MKTLTLLITIALAFNLSSSFAQSPPAIEWQNTIGGGDNEYLYAVTPTSDGGYILAGNSKSSISGDKTEASQGVEDYWVVKLYASGSVEWQNDIGGSNVDYLKYVAQTTDGGYILGGYSISDASGDKTENSQGGYDYWIVKLYPSGLIEWQNTIGGSLNDAVSTIKQTSDGGYIIGGYSSSGVSGDKTEPNLGVSTYDYWIIKLNSTGEIQWQNTIGGNTSDQCTYVEQVSGGGYIVAGYSLSGISGDKTQASKGGIDYWILKLSDAGNIDWQKTLGGSANDFASSVHETAGGYIVGGYSSSGISGDKTEVSQGTEDYWVVKLDYSGNIVWQNTIGGNNTDQLYAVDQTSNGGYILIGNSSSGISGDKTSGLQGVSDFWVVKLNSLGSIDWQETIGGSNSDIPSDVRQSADGGYILGGYSSSPISGDKTETSQGGTDYWIVKLAPDCVQQTFYADADGDGFGDPSTTVMACIRPNGYVNNSLDCNDIPFVGYDIHPGSTEICNGVDDDCDAVIDYTFNLTASSGINGFISPDGTTTMSCGSNQTFTITPDAGYAIADVLVDNISVGAVSSYTFNDIQGNHTIAASFMTINHITLSLSNCASTSPNTFEFDLYILNDGTSSLKLNALAYGVNVNTGILANSSDNLSMGYVGGSDLPSAISGSFNFNYSSSIHQLRFTSSSLAVTAATAPTLPNGTPVKVGRFRVTNNSNNWAAASTTNLTLNTATGGFNTNSGITAYVGSNTTTTALNNATYRDVQADCSITLNCTPVIVCPSNITVNNDAGICGAMVTFTDPEVSGCPGVTLTQTAGLASGATFPVGITTNTFKATDPSGNFSTCSFTVTVHDNEAPAVPALATVTGECSASVTAPTATDNCSGIITGTTMDAVSYNVQGTYTIHWTFDDGNGNTSTADQTVIVDDVTPPVVPTLATVTGECSASVTAPITTDNCSGTITGTTTDDVSYNTQGMYTVHWTFDDGNGNTSTADQTVIVDDVTPPVVPTLAAITGECSASVTAPTTTDNCSGTITGTTTDAVSYNAQGTYTIHWTFDDGNGNTSTADQTVTVDDVTPPSISCPADIIVQANSGGCTATGVSLGAPTGSDNCGAVTFSNNAPSGFPLGNTTVTWTADDGHGNTSICAQTVTVTNPASVSLNETDNSGVVADDGILCAGIGGATLTASGAISYTWSPETGLSATTGASVTATPTVTTTYTVTGTTAIGCVATATVTITVETCTSDLALKFFIQGYYDGGGMMKSVLHNQDVDPNPSSTNVDTVIIELHPSASPSDVEATFKGVLQTDGTIGCNFPSSVIGHAYYIVIKHRSALQTWSANPVVFSYNNSYDFTDAASKTYWNNAIEVESGVWAIYNGDINQDESIDIFDVPELDFDIQNNAFGYFRSDLDGTGMPAAYDWFILDTNSQNFVGSIHP